MTWATDRRLDYIDWCLASSGEVQRADLMRTFDVSESQASADINEFLAAYPTAAVYDRSCKRYVPAAERRYKRRRLGVWVRAIDWAAIDTSGAENDQEN